MPYLRSLHLLARPGEAKLGWVDTGILYSELRGNVSRQIAEQYASQLGAFLDTTSRVQLLLDSSTLRSCDPAGKVAILEAFTTHRQRIAHVTILGSAEARRPHGPCLWNAFGDLVEYVPGRAAFATRVLQLAPLAAPKIEVRLPTAASL